VLDLGCAAGSFRSDSVQAEVVRADLESPHAHVHCDARQLPFAAKSFDAAILNHSLEHFEDPARVLREVRLLLREPAYLYIAVPDGSTLADRLYRWLGRGGGHVNQFNDLQALIRLIESETGLRHTATRDLYTSLSFLNRNNMKKPPLRLFLLGGGSEWLLRWGMLMLRKLDRLFGTRTSIYGWACWFGEPVDVDQQPWSNVCIRCGSGYPAAELQTSGFPRGYRCPACGTRNYITP